MSHPQRTPKPSRKRLSTEERKVAILEAALDVFSDQGFAAARLDDVAAKAEVAKGTLYLYFADKEALFEELLRWVAMPALDEVVKLASLDEKPAIETLRLILNVLQKNILSTRRAQVFRLFLAEGHKFPRIASFYHQHIISRGREVIARLGARGFRNGELKTDALARFPQLFFAPIMLAMVWNAIFSQHDPLDTEALLIEHARVLFGDDREENQ